MMREICPGCGIELERVELPMHAYIGASASCWALYNELLAREYEGFVGSLPANQALTRIRVIDAYAVQHHGKPERRAIQSVNAHLVALYLQLEKGYSGEQVNAALQRVLKFANEFVWLEPPTPNGTMTIADVLRAQTPEEQANAIEKYARDIWSAWQVHRETVLKWAARLEK